MTQLSHSQYLPTLEKVQTIAREAGGILHDAYHQPRHIDYKGEVDLVTQADLAAEKYIIEALQEYYPDYAIVAEESGLQEGNTDLTWLIDPLDGTTNFAHGFPVFAVSIALRDEAGSLLGVVYDPLRDECFSAARGYGATLNGQSMGVTHTPALKKALLATGFPYNRHTAEQNNVEAFSKFIRLAQGVRRAGAAALDLAYVACGRLDGYWERGLNAWDAAAGLLLVKEARGMISDYHGHADSHPMWDGKQMVASNGHIHNAMLETLGQVYQLNGGVTHDEA